jgi:hypothetical protein
MEKSNRRREGKMKRDGNRIFVGDRMVGYLTRDELGRVWYKSPRKYSIHHYRKIPGWAVSEEVVDFIEANKVYGICLEVEMDVPEMDNFGQKQILLSSIANFRLHGVKLEWEEPQILLPDRHWLSNGQQML